MLKSAVRVAFRLALFAACLWLIREAAKRWVDGPAVAPSSEPWPQVSVGDRPSAPPPVNPQASVKSDTAIVEPEAQAPVSQASVDWLQPNGTGSAPPSHPVKAKLTSKLYHLPGMAAYERTRPDRCYRTAEAAEADGFTRAKR